MYIAYKISCKNAQKHSLINLHIICYMFIVELEIPIRKGLFLRLLANLEGSQIIWIQSTCSKDIIPIG